MMFVNIIIEYYYLYNGMVISFNDMKVFCNCPQTAPLMMTVL